MSKRLDNYTVPQLRAMAKARGLSGYSGLRKAELIARLRKTRSPRKKKPAGKCPDIKCKKAEVCNPASGRCVKKSGRIGKELLEKGNKKTASPIKLQKSSRKVITKEPEVFLFTKAGCGYCQKAKNLLDKSGIRYEYHDIPDEDKEFLYAHIDGLTGGHRTFPIVFTHDKFIGGYQELEKYIRSAKIA